MLPHDVGSDAGEGPEGAAVAAVVVVALWALVPAAVAALYEDLLLALVLACVFRVGALFSGVDTLRLDVRAGKAPENKI